jgi:hypothetical protein
VANPTTAMKKILSALAILSITVTSCTKETKLGPQAQVKFINGSANTVSAEVTFDGLLLVGQTPFQDASPYAFVNVGTPNIRVQATSNASTTVLVNVIGNATFQSNINYSIVATDSTHKLKVSIITDDLPIPVAGRAYVRFLHLIGNSPALTVDTSLVTTTGGPLFSSRTFNDQATNSSAASFVTVNAGTYNFMAKNGSTTVFSKSIPLESGRIYTIAATGTVGGTVGTPQAQAFTVLRNN